MTQQDQIEKQDLYNKVVSASLIIYFMIMFALSWWFNRPLNMPDFVLSALTGIFAHFGHLTYNIMASRNIRQEN